MNIMDVESYSLDVPYRFGYMIKICLLSSQGADLCYWPGADAINMTLQRVEPDRKWELYYVKILGKFCKLLELCVRACICMLTCLCAWVS